MIIEDTIKDLKFSSLCSLLNIYSNDHLYKMLCDYKQECKKILRVSYTQILNTVKYLRRSMYNHDLRLTSVLIAYKNLKNMTLVTYASKILNIYEPRLSEDVHCTGWFVLKKMVQEKLAWKHCNTLGLHHLLVEYLKNTWIVVKNFKV